jgi:hypothetical protein
MLALKHSYEYNFLIYPKIKVPNFGLTRFTKSGVLQLCFAPAATWNLHTTQTRTLLPTCDEVVNLTGLL